jgi:hypothetical protein
LIFKYRPQLNKLYVALAGLIWGEKSVEKHREIVGKKIYIYLKLKTTNILELIYISPSRSYFSHLLGYERSLVKKYFKKKFWII